jgi:hypothetical protein
VRFNSLAFVTSDYGIDQGRSVERPALPHHDARLPCGQELFLTCPQREFQGLDCEVEQEAT